MKTGKNLFPIQEEISFKSVQKWVREEVLSEKETDLWLLSYFEKLKLKKLFLFNYVDLFDVSLFSGT